MKVLTIIFMTAITMALSITLTMKKMTNVVVVEEEEKPPFKHIGEKMKQLPLPLQPPKRVSRFLALQKNPRAADHCHKDHEVCSIQDEEGFGYKNSTCCNNKCVDVAADNHHCGACKNKCEYTEACCGGKCVYLAYDKRHCGRCGNRCNLGLFCIYGMCDYP